MSEPRPINWVGTPTEPGIPVGAPITKTSFQNPYPTHYDYLGFGGFVVFVNQAERDGFPASQRIADMRCVVGTGQPLSRKCYRLLADLVTWEELPDVFETTEADNIAALANVDANIYFGVHLLGALNKDDGGGGLLQLTTGTADNVLSYPSNRAGLVWKRTVTDPINVLWAGADPTGTVDSSAAWTRLNNVPDGSTISFPPGTFRTSVTLRSMTVGKRYTYQGSQNTKILMLSAITAFELGYLSKLRNAWISYELVYPDFETVRPNGTADAIVVGKDGHYAWQVSIEYVQVTAAPANGIRWSHGPFLHQYNNNFSYCGQNGFLFDNLFDDNNHGVALGCQANNCAQNGLLIQAVGGADHGNDSRHHSILNFKAFGCGNSGVRTNSRENYIMAMCELSPAGGGLYSSQSIVLEVGSHANKVVLLGSHTTASVSDLGDRNTVEGMDLNGIWSAKSWHELIKIKQFGGGGSWVGQLNMQQTGNRLFEINSSQDGDWLSELIIRNGVGSNQLTTTLQRLRFLNGGAAINHATDIPVVLPVATIGAQLTVDFTFTNLNVSTGDTLIATASVPQAGLIITVYANVGSFGVRVANVTNAAINMVATNVRVFHLKHF